jgi:predicted DsbA family dithiol-disulfide isomerase
MRRVLFCIAAWASLAAAAPLAAAPADDDAALKLPGLDVSHLNPQQRHALREELDKYPSACGRAQSLASSLRSDPGCRRSPFAARFLAMLIGLGLTTAEVEEHYEQRFVNPNRGECKPGQVRGDPRAPVSICEFSDFQCPHCRAVEPILARLLDEERGKVRLTFKNYPISSLHPDAREAAAAAVAAGWQGKFWEMHDLLFQHQDHLAPPDLERLATSLKLDLGKWRSDLPAARAKVDADHDEGQALHVSHTPTLYIGGREYKGPLKYETIKDWIDEELSR